MNPRRSLPLALVTFSALLAPIGAHATWPVNGVPVSTAIGDQSNPQIVTDGSGGAIITWLDIDTDPSGNIFAQRVNAQGVVQWTANGVAICVVGPFIGEDSPVIASDGAGGAIVAWLDYRTSTGNPGIYAQRVNASGVVQWVANGVAIYSSTFISSNNPAIISDGAGGAIVTFLKQPNNLIYAQRVNAQGVVQWTAGGVALCTSSGARLTVPCAISSDGAGGVVATWQENRNAHDFDIFAQRIGSGGAIPTSIGDTPSFADVSLSANSPNPFNGETTIDLNLTVGANVEINVYDVTGRAVRQSGRAYMGAGSHELSFDGRDDKGRPLASGMYFYKVTANGRTITQKMVIAR